METSSITFRDTHGVESANTSDSVRGEDPGEAGLQRGLGQVLTDDLLRQGSKDLKFFATHAEPSSSEPQQHSHTKRKRKRPPIPPRPKGAFIFYSAQFRAAYKKKHPRANLAEMTKAAGAAWKELSDEEKKPFVEMATQDKERYAREKLACRSDVDGGQKKRKGVFLYFFEDFKKRFSNHTDGKKLTMPELSKEAGKAWQQLPAEEKAKYADIAKEDTVSEQDKAGMGMADPHPGRSEDTSGPSHVPNPLEEYQQQLHDQIHELMGTLKRFHQQQSLFERAGQTRTQQANLSPFVTQLPFHPGNRRSTGGVLLPADHYRPIESSHPALLPRPRQQRRTETILLKGKVLD